MESKGEVVIYSSDSGSTYIEVTLENDTLWLSLNQIAQLFGRDKSVVSRHLRNIYGDGELNEEATVAKNATVQKEGSREVKREIELYNLDAIISIGYRVNSKRGTQFRIWATQTLRDHLVRGYTLNEKRLKEQQEKFKELYHTVCL
ncbi:MAG: virulence factor [Flaviaesturariibacter sp.]|nr:virulence factor [Flaviaesturariibacter sp.]